MTNHYSGRLEAAPLTLRVLRCQKNDLLRKVSRSGFSARRGYKLYLEDILESAISIQSYDGTLSYEELIRDKMRVDAIIRNQTPLISFRW